MMTGCGNHVHIHIGDYCVEREMIRVICPDCLVKMARGEHDLAVESGVKAKKVFWDVVENKDTVSGKSGEEIGVIGSVCLILCDDEKGHDIHLNQMGPPVLEDNSRVESSWLKRHRCFDPW
jgi:hypothetical protein